MPYSDPAKKREYMKRYNPKYYEETKEPRKTVSKNTGKKRILREEKTLHIKKELGNSCFTCGEQQCSIVVAEAFSPLPKAIADHSWIQINLLLQNEVFSLTCSDCRKYGPPSENH
jgi:hypothetical protein